MATKDWKRKRILTDEVRFENMKSNKSIILVKSYMYGSKTPIYRILVNSLSGGTRYKFKGELNGYKVKTKTEGIKLMTAYMRKHYDASNKRRKKCTGIY